VIPDAEKIVGRYLREHPDLVALGARVVSKTPDNVATGWVRVSQLDDPAVGGRRSDHLIEFMLQLDCYAGATGGQPEASLLNRTVRQALTDMPGEHYRAVVTGVQHLSAPRLPDSDFEPARERYARTVLVWMHPAPEDT
jgi:hypothetical protein